MTFVPAGPGLVEVGAHSAETFMNGTTAIGGAVGRSTHSGGGDLLLDSVARVSRAATNAPRVLAWPAGLFLLIAFGVAADLAYDLSVGAGTLHLTIEAIALIVALCGVVATGFKLRAALRDSETLLGELELTTLDLMHWREQAAGRAATASDEATCSECGKALAQR
jgi:hypothetical protein